ncbi:peptidoglycan DD-metalloendopeptidase family protein [Budviciaceae bacterium CWB-B4]|uniref:Peptidoglycan DD-metalloendopeptidase family protein n=2 Tax=Limnobaculum xujianqingii TaxID=2738837 RepID=A0A9D7FY77_9GAMM|nr:peptidoglycan DD-metalloendopeptidase family protein [Limnobaculum xujianqingii]MBK5176736.1 peptidoglycan DD-metalloendopeptidase family protein [Limnobaculum xujianqingii]
MSAGFNIIKKVSNKRFYQAIGCCLLLVTSSSFASQSSSSGSKSNKASTAKVSVKSANSKTSNAKTSNTKTSGTKTASAAKSSGTKSTKTKASEKKVSVTKTAKTKSTSTKTAKTKTAKVSSERLSSTKIADAKSYSLATGPSSSTMFRYPTAEPFKVTSQFDPSRLNPVTRKRAPHEGIDFSMPIGSTVVSTGEGEVVIAKYSPSAGNYIVIRHKNSYETYYMHLSKLMVQPGQKVSRGQKIALSGNTGRSTGAHLHYELRVNDRAVDPLSSDLILVNNFNLPNGGYDNTRVASNSGNTGRNPFGNSKTRDVQFASYQGQEGGFAKPNRDIEYRSLGEGRILYTMRSQKSAD